jgi:hypothetical protein
MTTLTLKPTQEFFMAGDVMVRMWQGKSDRGENVVALITAVAFAGKTDLPTFTEDLVSIPAPDAEDARRWAEKIMGQPG